MVKNRVEGPSGVPAASYFNGLEQGAADFNPIESNELFRMFAEPPTLPQQMENGEMSYCYDDERPKLFTESGQRDFLKIRDEAARLCKLAGCVRMQEMMVAGQDSWFQLACADRLVELGELVEIRQSNIAGQHRVFYRPHIG